MPPQPAYSLRPVGQTDAEWLWHLKVATLRSYVEATWGDWNEDQQRAFAARDLRSPSLRIIVMAEEGDAGAIDVARRGSEWFLNRLELLPRLQRRGLGRMLISDLQRDAAVVGMPIRLQVLQVNPAQSLYRRLGFQEVGITTSHILMSWTPGNGTLKTASPPGRIA
jgi:ribosomal protein S18 acetylase RimI-like enzyme